MKKKICFIASVPNGITSFQRTNIERLSEKYDVYAIANFKDKSELGNIKITDAFPVAIERRPNIRQNIKALKELYHIFKDQKFDCCVSMSCNASLLAAIAGKLAQIPFRIRIFTGQVWANMSGIKRKIFKCLDRLTVILNTHTMVDDQANEYANDYGIKTSTLFKCGTFPDNLSTKEVRCPIRMVYAGRLYCNRWKSLAEIGKALRIINCDDTRIILDIFTQDNISNEQRAVLSPDNFIYLKGSVNQRQLSDEYRNADIAVHVESLDKKYKLATRVSFSTKIIDLMASTCAILAICWNQHTGYKYLKENDAALCVGDYKDILPLFRKICDNTQLIKEYAQKAYDCGSKNHSKAKIQRQLLNIFTDAINNNSHGLKQFNKI